VSSTVVIVRNRVPVHRCRRRNGRQGRIRRCVAVTYPAWQP